jgi:hypothetical protein
MVRLDTTTGAIDIPATVSNEIKEGVLMVYQFWGHQGNSGQMDAREKPGVNVNFLHSDLDLEVFTGMPVFNGKA